MKNFNLLFKLKKLFPALIFLILIVLSPSNFAQKDQVKNSVNSELISSYKLAQNFPNPFNPTTQINYAIPVETHVELSVYNLLGNKVVTIVNEHQSAGEYSVKFSASDLPSGVYFYKLQTDEFTSTKKLTVLK